MTTTRNFPVFAANQVLRHDHLNDLVTYLEEQIRLTRNKTIGIGVVCGFRSELGTLSVGNQQIPSLFVSEGVGITSAGFLIHSPGNAFSHFANYTTDRELSTLEKDIAANALYTQNMTLYKELASVYPFFKDPTSTANVVRSGIFELIAAGDPTAGYTGLTPITEASLNGKVLLAYLNCDLKLLKTCTANNCDDKGSKLELQVRFLLVTTAVAEAILVMEKTKQNVSQLPIHTSTAGSADSALIERQGYYLAKAKIEKVDFYESTPVFFGDLQSQYAQLVSVCLLDTKTRLQESKSIYDYILSGLYVGNSWGNMTDKLQSIIDESKAQDLIPVQYCYDFATHLVDAFNEFRAVALEFDAICYPSEEVFPKHLFLGKMDASSKDMSNDSLYMDRSSFMMTGSGFFPIPDVNAAARYRHRFIPAPELHRQNELIEKIWTLHYRMYEMIMRFDISASTAGGIRMVPSKTKDFPISERCGIPYYFNVTKSGISNVLLRLWSHQKTVKNQLNYIHSYQTVASGTHPLSVRLTDENLYRIEGHVGMKVEDVVTNILDLRKRYGLDFKIKLANLSDKLVDKTILGNRVELFNIVANRDPGMEHMAGVPRGGTFIIAFDQKVIGPTGLTPSEKSEARVIFSSGFLHLGETDNSVSIAESRAAGEMIAYLTALTAKSMIYFEELLDVINLKTIKPKADYDWKVLTGDAMLLYFKSQMTLMQQKRAVAYGEKVVLADFALNYACCEDVKTTSGTTVNLKECEYEMFINWDEVQKYSGVLYFNVITYDIQGTNIGAPVKMKIVIPNGTHAQKTKAFTDAMNIKFPNGLYFSPGVTDAAKFIRIKSVENQLFELEFAYKNPINSELTEGAYVYKTAELNGYINPSGDLIKVTNCLVTSSGYVSDVYDTIHIKDDLTYVDAEITKAAVEKLLAEVKKGNPGIDTAAPGPVAPIEPDSSNSK